MTHVATAPLPAPVARTGTGIHWDNCLAILVSHVGCFAAPWFFSWSAVGVAFFLYWACLGLGISLCYHRLLTHRSFRTSRWFEYVLTILGTANSQGGPLWWVGTHRLHHRHADLDEDPHTPRHGFNWAHVLWSLASERAAPDVRFAAGDLARDPVMVVIDRYHWVSQVVLAGLLYALGGWAWFIWGICVRTTVSFHMTWFVNSVCHTWGYRNFNTPDDSTNNWWVSVFTFGEGWHNNHHAEQRSAAHGLRWWEFDVTFRTVQVLEGLGLVRRVVRPGVQKAGVPDSRARRAA